MKASMSSQKRAIQAIEAAGILLVYPLQNRKLPASIWSALYPRSPMKWEWDTGSDHRVADLWHLREELSRSRRVVYAKWFQGRATFFSTEVFMDLLAAYGSTRRSPYRTTDSARVLEVLRSDSPLSTKDLKRLTDLQGRRAEARYQRAMKPLWQGLYVVGFGEIEDSSFPSLAIGATELLHEGLWQEAQTRDPAKAWARVHAKLGEGNPFLKFAERVRKATLDRPDLPDPPDSEDSAEARR